MSRAKKEQSSAGQSVTVTLSEQELQERGLELAQVTALLDELKQEKGLITKLYGDWEKELQARKRELSLAIRHGVEDRPDQRQSEFFEQLSAITTGERRPATAMPEGLQQARRKTLERAERAYAERGAEQRGGGSA